MPTEIKPGTELTHLRIIEVAYRGETNNGPRYRAECLHCGAELTISYSGLKTRRTNGTRHCRKCTPMGSGPLAMHRPGLEIAGVTILRERPRRSKKLDNGNRPWDVKCVRCGHEFARTSNRLRYHDQHGESCCPRCDAPETTKQPPAKKPKPPAIGRVTLRLSGRRGSQEVPLATLGPVFEAARI